MFKLRYSYGKVGSDNIGTRFPYLELFESRNPYNWGDYNTPNVDNGQIYKQISSSGVTWEIATKHDIGVDFSLWDDRFYWYCRLIFMKHVMESLCSVKVCQEL